MVLTPTYYVFEMYKVHQQAALLPLTFKSPEYVFEGKPIPAVTASASRDKMGIVHMTFTQADPHNEIEISVDIRGLKPGSVKGRIITSGELNAHNSFENPEVVKSADFKGAKLNNNSLTIKLPPASVVLLELR